MLFKKELNDAGKNILNMQMFKNVLGSSFKKNLQYCVEVHIVLHDSVSFGTLASEIFLQNNGLCSKQKQDECNVYK